MAKESTSQELVPVRSSSDLVALDEFDSILRGLRDAPAVEVIDDPELIGKQIVEQILAAQSVEDVFSVVGNTVGWRELAGVPVELHGFRWRPSDYEQGAPVFVIVFATRLDDGDQVGLTTGSYNVLAQLSALARLGELNGTRVMLREAAKASSRGFKPLHLIRLHATPTSETLRATATVEDEGAV